MKNQPESAVVAGRALDLEYLSRLVESVFGRAVAQRAGLHRGYDLVDAGRGLFANGVATPAGQGAVVALRHGRVDELAEGAVVAIELRWGDLEVLAAVVELPDEVDLAGVGFHLATHAHRLLQ